MSAVEWPDEGAQHRAEFGKDVVEDERAIPLVCLVETRGEFDNIHV